MMLIFLAVLLLLIVAAAFILLSDPSRVDEAEKERVEHELRWQRR